MGLMTLKVRRDFQRVRGGGRWTCASFVMEAKVRPDIAATLLPSPKVQSPASKTDGGLTSPRFGFTITKKVGNAVVRNKIRRRLKSALTQLAPLLADRHTDYVIVARLPSLDRPYTDLLNELTTGLKKVRAANALPNPPPAPNAPLPKSTG
jgi:ribonuclease P protein component